MCLSNKQKFPSWKRLLDILLVILTSVITIPLSLMIMVYIKLKSSGPILYSQERIGFNGKVFNCYKFRTMKYQSSSSNHATHIRNVVTSDKPMTKLDSTDGRIIKGVQWLRDSGLDELPQLINILKGEMSLVGPRPCLTYEYELFKHDAIYRFTVLPGLTGLWQISGKNNTTFKEMIMFDIEYIQNCNIFMDIKIIISTIKVVFGQLFKRF